MEDAGRGHATAGDVAALIHTYLAGPGPPHAHRAPGSTSQAQAGREGSKRPLCDLNVLSSTALPPHLVTECLGRGCPDVRFVQGFLQGHPRKGPMQIHQGHEQERGGAAREEPLCHGSGAGGNRDPRGVPLWNRLPVSRGVSADWLPERATGAGWASSCMVSAGLWLCCMN